MMSEISNKITVDAEAVKNGLQGSWRDFWNFQLMVAEDGPITLGIVIVALACFVVGIIFARAFSRRLTKRFLSRFHFTPNALHIWSSLTLYLSCVFVTLIALKIAHVPLTIFTLLGGGLAVGVGFGSKNLINNFISGIMFMFEAPVKVGEYVEVAGMFGQVLDIGLRATHVQVAPNRQAIIPNSSFLEGTLINWGRPGTIHNMSVMLSVEYGENLKRVEDVLKKSVADMSEVVKTLPMHMWVKDFADSGISIEFQFPVQLQNRGDRDDVPALVRLRIAEAFAREHISIPYPQMVLRRESAPPAKTSPSPTASN